VEAKICRDTVIITTQINTYSCDCWYCLRDSYVESLMFEHEINSSGGGVMQGLCNQVKR
jgi:hypothetical protein